MVLLLGINLLSNYSSLLGKDHWQHSFKKKFGDVFFSAALDDRFGERWPRKFRAKPLMHREQQTDLITETDIKPQ